MFFILVALTTLTKLVESQAPSPCPNVFTYDSSKKESDKWHGILTLKTREDLTGVYLNVVLDRQAQLLGNWFGDVTSNDNVEFTIVNQKYKLEAGPPVVVNFFVKYNPALTIPSIETIRLNGRTVCSSRSEGTRRTTTDQPRLSHTKATPKPAEWFTTKPATLESNNADYDNEPPPKKGNIDDSFFTSEIVNIGSSNIPTAVNNRPSVTNNQNVACGTIASATSASPLISFGQHTKPGQWPWHAALYYSKGIQLIYSCGATLITKKHVLTAAHCVTKPRTTTTVQIENIRVYLGKHDLVTFGNEVQERSVKQIFVHPDYNDTTYYNDIAVIKLSRPVDITNYVRTACLWSDDVDLESVVDKEGTVVGWGFDENRKLSNKLMQAKMPVVQTLKCIYSNRDFYSQFTSDNNFCAGFRNGTSVCNGDSGGGMVFPKSGTSGQNTVWQIRGIVSVGVALQGEGLCDTSQYILFTDVAKYLSWIRQTTAY